MLVLTWRPGECLRIGEKVTIRVLSIKGNRVRIAVEAPEDIEIQHADILEQQAHPPQLEEGTRQRPRAPVSLRIVRSDK